MGVCHTKPLAVPQEVFAPAREGEVALSARDGASAAAQGESLPTLMASSPEAGKASLERASTFVPPTGRAMTMGRIVNGRLAEKVAIITGASKGIGKGIAIMFAAQGAKVVINYRSDPAGADDAVQQCEKHGGPGCAVKIHGDVGDKAACDALIEAAFKQFGQVDILVNNAGMEIHDEFLDVKEADYDKVMDVNMKGPFFCSQAFVRKCVENNSRGTVINMSSVHEDLPFPGFTAYCASKGAMKMMTRNLSIELAPKGIRVNNIAPGAIETPINASVLKDPVKLNELLEKIPLCRLGKPEDISLCAVYLASDESTYVTGTTIVVDGGLTWMYIENH